MGERMEERRVAADTSVFIGAPEHPIPDENVLALKDMLSEIPEVLEAHLPHVYAAGVFDPPAQVLAIVVSSDRDGEIAANRIGEWFRASFAAGSQLDIWPLKPQARILATVRGTNTEVKRRRKWWRFWG